MLWQERGVNWNDLPAGFKRGRVIERVAVTGTIVYTDRRTGQECQAEGVTRHVWRINDTPPIFSQERGWLLARIPQDGGGTPDE
jgi:tRNA(His) 5'-end guanylyltransferase